MDYSKTLWLTFAPANAPVGFGLQSGALGGASLSVFVGLQRQLHERFSLNCGPRRGRLLDDGWRLRGLASLSRAFAPETGGPH